MTAGRTGRLDLLFLTAGGLIWAVRFSAVYAVTAIACVAGWAGTRLAGFALIDWIIVGSAALGILANAAVIAAAWQRSPGAGSAQEGMSLIDLGAAGVAALSILAITWEAMVIALPICN